jgi:hypothetical protein
MKAWRPRQLFSEEWIDCPPFHDSNRWIPPRRTGEQQSKTTMGAKTEADFVFLKRHHVVVEK